MSFPDRDVQILMFAHDYGSMDKERIWQTATEDVPALKAYCERAMAESFYENIPQAALSTRCRLFFMLSETGKFEAKKREFFCWKPLHRPLSIHTIAREDSDKKEQERAYARESI